MLLGACQSEFLLGKYKPGNVPTGPRGAYINEKRVREVQSLIEALTAMGKEHGDKTPAQVAINWILCKGNPFFSPIISA